MKLDNPIHTHIRSEIIINYKKYPHCYASGIDDSKRNLNMWAFFQAPENEIERTKYKRKNWYACAIEKSGHKISKENIQITHKAATKKKIYESVGLSFIPKSNKEIQMRYRLRKRSEGSKRVTINLDHWVIAKLEDNKYSSIEEGVNKILKAHFEKVEYNIS